MIPIISHDLEEKFLEEKKKKRIRAAKIRLGSRAVIRKSREEVPREERKRRGNDRDTEYACFLFKGFIALSIHPFIRSTRAHPTLQDTSRLSSRVPHAPLLPPLLSRRFFLFSHFPSLPPRPSTALFVADYSFQEFFTRLYFDNIFANKWSGICDNFVCEILKKVGIFSKWLQNN